MRTLSVQVAEATIAAAFLSAMPGTAHADDLQNQLLTGMRASRADLFAFRQTIAIEQSGSPRKVFVEQFDPRQPAPRQWSLVSVDGHPPTAKDLENHRKVKRGPVPSYANLARWIGGTATRSEPSPGTVLYRFARLPGGVFKIGSHDASADTTAEALINTKGQAPFVEKVRLILTKGFRMMLVASVQSMVVNGRYRPLADGHVVPVDSISEISGALMGKTGTIRTSVSFSDFQPAR